MTEQEFAQKIETEGGIFEALTYGLKASDLDEPSDLKSAWALLENVFRIHVAPALAIVECALEEVEGGVSV